ncbi:MAG: hypothetical protein QGG36_01450 [Pirellulaceae bacterium]|jgi:DNA-binding transcriptional ArsR family regulator|nr:hypothetical protein [Pirellulaceae bacterium]MDP7014444.1 hypothetical protein [Pirellulaceae bacterium]
MRFSRDSRTLWVAAVALTGSLIVGAVGRGQDQSARDRVAALSPSELKELQRKRTRFSQLDVVEQERLRDLHAALRSHEKSTQLQSVLNRYSAWLKTLPAGQRAELLGLPMTERVERIKSIMAEQEESRFERLAASQLNSSDHRVMMSWMREFVTSHSEKLTLLLPEEVRSRLSAISDGQRRAVLYSTLGRNDDALEIIRQHVDIDELSQKLSEKARGTLRAETDPLRRAAIIRNWSRAAAMSGFYGARSMPEVSDEELTRFYKEELNDNSREYLNSLPAEKMKRELKRWYVFRKNRPSFGAGRRGGGEFRGGGRGRGRGPDGERKPEPPSERESKSPQDKTSSPPTADPDDGSK